MQIVKCPTCGRGVEYKNSEFRPFCSERCKLLDLGAWADEKYNLPSENSSLAEEDLREIERAREEKDRS